MIGGVAREYETAQRERERGRGVRRSQGEREKRGGLFVSRVSTMDRSLQELYGRTAAGMTY